MTQDKGIGLADNMLPSSLASPAITSPYLTAKEAATYLRMSYSTFRKKARLIKMMPGTHKYRREDLDEFAQSNRRRILR
jgi:hypothetical protein